MHSLFRVAFMQIKINIKLEDFKVNRVVKFFVLSDLFFLGGWGLVNPIFAIFVVENIPNTSALTVGALAFTYWIVKSIVQMPVAVALDKREGEKDDFYTLLFALVLSGFAAICFALVKDVFWLFVVQILHGASQALYTPSWSAIFSRHLDKERYAFDWSLDNTTISMASAIAGLVGGVVVSFFGFKTAFLFASVLSFVGAFILMFAPDLILPKPTLKVPFIRDHTPGNINQ